MDYRPALWAIHQYRRHDLQGDQQEGQCAHR